MSNQLDTEVQTAHGTNHSGNDGLESVGLSSRRGLFDKLWRTGLRHPVLGICGVLIILGIWIAISTSGLEPPIILPSPLAVLEALRSIITSNSAGANFGASASEFGYGLLLSIIFGIPIGLFMGWYRTIGSMLDPLVNFLYATPRIALVPLVIIWFGIGLTSKVVIVLLMAVFPIIINTISGVRNLQPELTRLARTFGASDSQMFRTVVLPATVPFVLAGVRLGVGQALLGVYIAELAGASYGIGDLMNTAGDQFQTATVLAGVMIFAMSGLIFTGLTKFIESKLSSWRVS